MYDYDYGYDTEDFLREQFFEAYDAEQLLNERKIEPLYYFRTKEGIGALLNEYNDIIKSCEYCRAPLGSEWVITYLEVREEASKEQIDALIKAIKWYKN